jgi:hypothetical protein
MTALFALSCIAGTTLFSCNRVVLGGGEDELDGGTDDAGGGGPRTLIGLRVVPDNDVLLVDLNQTASKDYKVLAAYSDGTKVDVTSQVTLTIDNPAVGQLSGSKLQSSTMAANKVDFTHLKATLDNYTGSANLTVVWLRTSGAAQDFFYSLPYQGPDQTQPLTFQTFIQSIDSFFAVDTTGSMTGEIANLNSSLSNTIIPAVKKAALKDAWFGVGAVEDFGVSPFGDAGVYPGQTDDQPFILLSPMNASVTTAQTAVGKLMNGAKPRGSGGDLPEGQMEALYQIASGAGNMVSGIVNIPPHQVKGTAGGVEFRTGAFPVITMITDAAFHAKGETRVCQGATVDYSANNNVKNAAHTRGETVAALNKICAKVIGLSAEPAGQPADCLATSDLTKFAQSTGALVPPEAWGPTGMRPAGCNVGQCCTGLNGAGVSPDGNGDCPLVFKIKTDGTGVGNQIVSGITNLALYSKFDVVTQTSGNTMGDGGAVITMGHTTADFIKGITPLDAMPSPPPTSKTPRKTMTGFTGVVPGAVVRFTIDAKNDFQMPKDVPQVFHATIKILAGGCTDLDQRDVVILVPPSAPPAIG